MNSSHREFTYQPRLGVIVAGVLFFGICGLVLRSSAASNDRGLTIDRIFELSREQATTFYWVLSWLSFAFVAVAVAMFVVRILNPQELVLSPDGLYAPKRAWSRRPIFVRYADVIALSHQQVGRQRFLKVEP